MPPTLHLYNLTAPTLIDLKVIKEVKRDERLKEVIAKLQCGEEVKNYSIQHDMLRYKGRIVIAKTSSLIPTIMHTYHDSVFGGHLGFLRTYKRLTGEIFLEGMKHDIQKYCEECTVCQRNKSLAPTPAGLLMPLEIPDRIWNDISMDFIEGLSKSVEYEVILVVVDWFSKYAHFLTLKHPFDAKTVADPSIKEIRNSTLDEQLKERDIALAALKDHLRVAQEKMKSYSDIKRRQIEFEEGEMVYLEIQPYRQVSMRKRRNGEMKNYLLTTIHPVFHISQLKRAFGECKERQEVVPYLTENHEWVAVPDEACGYTKNDKGEWEVLMSWKGLPRQEATWEKYDDFQQSSWLKYKNGNHDAFEMLEKLKDVIVIPKGLRVSESIQATSQAELDKTIPLDPGGVPPPSKRRKLNKQN
ncbi:transposon Tf2-1 polyprotein isoform X1 [Cucumis melo var. makuwa]|uniref:Transposon Tf2-1 polyprotein isoform X1 n=1 Tax=Cucumis melo var. makuwa TaxID=1194695 RepID=A0A5A7VA22_CUCMM|nr:transposon Tf2-1 polyprotein isoform X1 [Cucumis melo var. makuwa]TYK18501.1 transposon Tf2-1 polyprotein isoform X1 [Cucumis melo var. makuwa]